MIQADFVVVGSGLTGATIARTLADAGREVVILERRSELGGNVIDALHEPSGIRYGKYGIHLFRTSCERIWEFATRFADFWEYHHCILTLIDGELVPWPLQRSYIERLCGKDWQSQPGRGRARLKLRNFEETCLSMMPRLVYEKAVKPYSEKQWGKPAHELSASLCKRFDVRDGEDRLTPNAKYQGIPCEGYSAWMRKMLRGIDVRLNFDYLQRRNEVQARRMLVFTGPIDEYYGFRLGRLEYRAQQREMVYNAAARKALIFPAQINNPQREYGRHIRTINWRELMPPEAITWGRLWTREYPYSPTDPDAYEYPMQDEANARLYAEYRKLAQAEERVAFAGRLGSFKYIDQDQAIGAALHLADKLLRGKKELSAS